MWGVASWYIYVGYDVMIGTEDFMVCGVCCAPAVWIVPFELSIPPMIMNIGALSTS